MYMTSSNHCIAADRMCMSGAPPCGQIGNRLFVIVSIFHLYTLTAVDIFTKSYNEIPIKKENASEKICGHKHKSLFAKKPPTNQNKSTIHS